MENSVFTKSVMKKRFYSKEPDSVAKSLLGKVLVRRIDGEVLCGKIVETEAYFGDDDPSSRAYGKKFRKFYEIMQGDVGKSFVYMVHNYWMFNAIGHRNGDVGGVLIRAVEPLIGWETLKLNRPVENIFELTNGPGKLSRAFLIDVTHNNLDMTSSDSEIFICDGGKQRFQIGTSYRIGVTKDLDEHFRFFIAGNPFVSKSKNYKK